MWTLLLVVFVTGSPALLQAAPVQGSSGRCSFAGVFYVEGTSRVSLTFQQALELCEFSLGYKLATQEQVNDAYQKALRTCRHLALAILGWIDRQNVMFLPYVNGPNCDSSSTEITFRPEATNYLSDVYCFNRSGEKSHDDILTEVETEGFLVDLEEILGRVKKDTSVQNDIPNTDMAIMKPSTVPALEKLFKTTHNEDSQRPTNKPRFGKSSVTPSVLFFDTEGSGSATEILTTDPEPRQFTTITIASNIVEKPIIENRRIDVDVSSEGFVPNESSENKPNAKQVKEHGPSTWLIIFGFCVVVGAIVCILAAIATRDKWYGPKESRNITTEVHNKDYSKTETLPLSDKEQEVVALMSVTKLNGKTDEITATTLEEHEKEYLM